MKKLLTTIAAALAVFLFSFGTTYAFTVFLSGQVGTSPVKGSVLLTDGTNSTWVATSTLGLGGSGGGTVNQVNTTYPILGGPITNTGTISLAFGTTTANIWSQLQTFAAGISSAGITNTSLGAGTVNSTSGGVQYATATSSPTVTAPIAYSGTLGSFIGGISGTFSCITATGSVAGCLSAADWTTFNNKQPAGNYITALTGDVTASGPGSAAATLATVNSNVGSFTSANITVNAKGLITAATNGSSGGTPGGLNTQLQYNNAGVFGGITGAVTDGTAVSLTNAHFLNPTINGAGTGLATLAYPNTSSSATITFPTVTGTLATLAGTEVLTNKDLTSGTNSFPTFNQNTTGSAATLTTSRTIGIATGDVTSAGSGFNGSANNTNAYTLATVNSNVGSFTNANVTVNAKGLIIAVSNGTAGGVTSVTASYPVISSGGATPSISLAFGTTTANSWSALQTLNGGLTLGTLTGVLHAASGVVSAAAVDLTSEVTGILPVASGGTGAASFTAGNRLVVSHGTSAFTDIALPLTVSNGGTGATSFTAGQLIGGNGTGVLFGVATTTATCAGTVSCSTFNILGSSPVTITGSGSGGSISTSTALANGNIDFSTGINTIGNDSTFFWDNTNKRLGVGSSTPYAQLGINAPAGVASYLAIGSSTGEVFSVKPSSAATLGIGTTSPGSPFSVGGITNFTTATSTFYGTGGINLAAGCFAVGGVCITGTGGISYLTNSGANTFLNTGTNLQAPVLMATSTTATSTFAGDVAIGGNAGNPNPYLFIGTSTARVPLYGRVQGDIIDSEYDWNGQSSINVANANKGSCASATFFADGNNPSLGGYFGTFSFLNDGWTGSGCSIGASTTDKPEAVVVASPTGELDFDIASTTQTGFTDFNWNVNNATKMKLTNAGNLGIGTTSPYGTLSINAAAQTAPYLVIGSSTGTQFSVSPSANPGPVIGLGTSTPYGKLSVNPVAGETVAFVIGSSTATQFKVNTNGNLFVPNIGTLGTGDVLCRNTSTGQIGDAGGATCTISNPLAKHDIRPLMLSDLGNFMKLNPIHYELNGSNIAQYGFNALEVNKIYPDAVELATEDIQVTGVDGNPVTIKKGQPKTVDYEHLVALDTYMIQQQELSLEKLGAGVRSNLTDDYQNWALGIMFLWLMVLTFRKKK